MSETVKHSFHPNGTDENCYVSAVVSLRSSLKLDGKKIILGHEEIQFQSDVILHTAGNTISLEYFVFIFIDQINRCVDTQKISNNRGCILAFIGQLTVHKGCKYEVIERERGV